MILCLAIFSLSLAHGQKNNLLAEKFSSIESIDWTTKTLDLGKLETGKKIEASFEFVNNTSKAVVLTNVKPSCGCTGVQYKKEAIKPGETAQIKVNYTPKKAGSFQKSVTVTTSANTDPVVLRFKGLAN